MKVIKFIGNGAVVERFITAFADVFSSITFEIYARSPWQAKTLPNNVKEFSLERFIPEDSDRIFYCCSANEREILKDSSQKGRVRVARANLAIVSDFIYRGFFKRGVYFVLTNPSEIIAEFIFRKTFNPNIYALGLSIDFRRYIRIFSQLGIDSESNNFFTLTGNHWDFPVPIFSSSSFLHRQLEQETSMADQRKLLDHLNSTLKAAIRREFIDHKPPIKSGALALKDAIDALSSLGTVLVSGLNAVRKIFTAGVLHCYAENKMKFISSPQGHPVELVDEIYYRHRLVLERLLAEFS